MCFDKKVVLVTGAGSGIGAQTAKRFAQQGARLALVDQNEDLLFKVSQEIQASGAPQPLSIATDVDKSDLIISTIVEHFSKLDVLINCAGVVVRQNITNIETAEFDRVMYTNLRSVVCLTKEAIPFLEKTKGNIVNVSSVVGALPSSELLAYSMSKSALNALTKCASVTLGPKGIRVNAVLPGITNTGD